MTLFSEGYFKRTISMKVNHGNMESYDFICVRKMVHCTSDWLVDGGLGSIPRLGVDPEVQCTLQDHQGVKTLHLKTPVG
ncbi:MAG: hypothetical protein RBT01_10630 [Anaerolineaceae bacterium]|jgi:hypothetical protein|nr:hypothetical protein [Anaerolineaceae bacterium]